MKVTKYQREREECKKCGEPATVLLHGRFPYCGDCYEEVLKVL